MHFKITQDQINAILAIAEQLIEEHKVSLQNIVRGVTSVAEGFGDSQQQPSLQEPPKVSE